MADEFQVALRGGLQNLLHLEERGLAEDGDHLGPAEEQFLKDRVRLRRPVLVMGAAEGGDAAAVDVAVLADFFEEISILGVGPGPAAFDVVDPELRQLLGNADLVGQGQGEVFRLGAVSQGGVVDFYLAHVLPQL